MVVGRPCYASSTWREADGGFVHRSISEKGLPLLDDTNVDLAREVLREAAIPQLIPATDLTDAAKKVCAKVA